MVSWASDSEGPWLGGSGLGSRAVAVTQLQLEPWGPGAAGAWPGVSLQRVSGCLHGAFLCGLGWSSSQHGGLRAVELFTWNLGLQV